MLPLMVACDASVEHFRANDLRGVTLASSRRVKSTGAAVVDAAAVTEDWFGTPDQPRWPADAMGSDLGVDAGRLVRAAGGVRSERDGGHFGLYREHCVTCHGLEGQGSGPAALFQNPYPRNLRHGVFKWKSTVRDAKPTRGDLMRTLHRGLTGSSMPSFAAVEPEDLETLVDYVVYLSVRGEVERELIAAAVDELGYGEGDVPAELRLSGGGGSEGGEVAAEVLSEVAEQWVAADENLVEVPAFERLTGDDLAASVQRGKALFHSPLAACSGCHGVGGGGEATLLDYDDWTKEYSTRIGIDPTDREAIGPLKRMGALTPRLAQPRNLRAGVYRGGGEPEDLYRRLSQGIAGSPMPGLVIQKDPRGTGVTEDQVWDLVRYLGAIAGEESKGGNSEVDQSEVAKLTIGEGGGQ